jgi:acyl transferase domain-containing protein
MPTPVAIIGMACTYPGARTVSQFWQNILNKVDAVTDVTPDRWDPEIFYDPDPSVEDRLYCKKGGWIGGSFAFNPLKYGVMPSTIDGAEPDHFLVLRAVDEALADAGYANTKLDGKRVSVILGKGNYLGPGVTGLMYRGIVTEQTLAIIKGLHPEISQVDLSAIKTAIRSTLARMNAELAPGLIPNICTGRVANRLDFMGRNFTVDAACASSLIATELALHGLSTGQDDLVLAGGVHIFAQIPFLQVFDAMRAVSLTSTIRPFDEHADGTICGEGVGILVLKRLADAERDGDRIYALVRSAASASDGRAKGVTAPRVEGETLALERAYALGDVAPATIGLIEAHGTATPVGDAAEVEALNRVFGSASDARPTCAIGSVKSMIGHAMPAAGAAGLIKAALSLYHGVLPPTLHCDTPRASLTRDDSRFYVNTETRPWIHGSDAAPRRAGVNAFGFGGINAHVVLEEYNGPRLRDESLARSWSSEVVLIDGDTRRELLSAIERVRAYAEQARGVDLRDLAATLNVRKKTAPHRLAVVAVSLADLADKLSSAATRLADPACTQIKDRNGLYYTSEPAVRDGKLAVLFPGEGSQHVNMLSELCVHFQEVRQAFDRADRAAAVPGRVPTSAIVFPPPVVSKRKSAGDATLWSIDRATEAVLAANAGVLALIEALGVSADMMAGHSAGEWIAMAAAGIVDRGEFVASLGQLSAIHQKLDADATIPRMCMLAVGASRDAVAALARDIDAQVEFANDNCAHQVVIVVAPEEELAVVDELRRRGVYVEKLPYERGYHTAAFIAICDPLREYFSSMNIAAPRIPLYSCSTAGLYSNERQGIIDLLSTTFARPLLFRQMIEAMYEAGARIFVESGPSGHLSAFVGDILRGRPHLTVPVDQASRSGLTALNHAIAMLAAVGVPLELEWLYQRRAARTLTFNPQLDAVDEDSAPGTVRVSTCYPRLQPPPPASHYESLRTAVSVATPVVAAPTSAPPLLQPATGFAASVMQEHCALMEEFLTSHEAVMTSYWGSGGTRVATVHATATATVIEAPPPAPPVVHEDRPAPATVQQPPDNAAILLRIVSERTGYPVDMLGLDLDLEADLGIDSIKRVEILSAVHQASADAATLSDTAMDELAKQKTLRQILACLERTVAAPAGVPPRTLDAGPGFGALTRNAVIIDQAAHESLTVHCEVTAAEHVYLRDHCLYHPAPNGGGGGGLVSMPMTCTIEMMAEIARVLCPGLKVIGARDIKALRWINFEQPDFRTTVSIAARKIGADRVHVVIRPISHERAPGQPEMLARATIVLGDGYPARPPAIDGALPAARAPLCTGRDVYATHLMFHGPSFQGLTSIGEIGEQGVRGSLTVLPNDRVLASTPAPPFHIDPFLLDAAGQLVGYWPSEYLKEGYVVLPIGIAQLVLYGERLPAGTTVDCRVRMKDITRRSIRADFDLVGADGTPFMRVVGWEDWRFYWDEHVYQFWRFPDRNANGLSIAIPTEPEVECRRIVPMSEMDNSGLWENLWMHMILSPDEIERCRQTTPVDARRTWLFERAAAKDAVRMWVQRHTGRAIWATDVEFVEDASGALRPSGSWTAHTPAVPHVAVSVSANGAIAAASGSPIALRVDGDAISVVRC